MKAMRSITVASILIAASSAPMANAAKANCASSGVATVEVDVQANGDDGLTQRLANAVRAAYGLCGSGYSVVEPGASGRLTTTIQENVRPRRIGARTRVSYRVGYSVYGLSRRAKSGACWEDRIQDCARGIVRGSPFVNME
jgi:hypothetical protein